MQLKLEALFTRAKRVQGVGANTSFFCLFLVSELEQVFEGALRATWPVLELISAIFGPDLRGLFQPLLDNLLAEFWELFLDTFLSHSVAFLALFRLLF